MSSGRHWNHLLTGWFLWARTVLRASQIIPYSQLTVTLFKKKKSLSSFLKWAKWSTQDVKKCVHTASMRQGQDLNSDLQMLKCVIFWRYGATCPLPSPWFLLLRGGKWESLQLPGLNHGLRCPTEHQVQVTWPLWVGMWRLKKEDGEKAWEMPSRDRQMVRSKMWVLTSDDSLHLPKGYSSCLLKNWW